MQNDLSQLQGFFNDHINADTQDNLNDSLSDLSSNNDELRDDVIALSEKLLETIEQTDIAINFITRILQR